MLLIAAIAAGIVTVTSAGASKGHVSAVKRSALALAGVPATSRPIRAVSGQQLRLFAIFRRAEASRGQVITARQAASFNGRPVKRFGVSIRLAQHAVTSDGSAWVAPGNDTVCINAVSSDGTSGVAGCGRTEMAANGQLVLWSGIPESSPPMVFVAGIAPDGDTQATVTARSGASTTVTIQDNVYTAVLAGLPAAVTLNGSASSVTVNLAGN
jgi:hypothetical protein